MSANRFLKKYLLERFLIIVCLLQLMRFIFYGVNRDMFLHDGYALAETFLKSCLFDGLSTLLYFAPYVIFMLCILCMNEIKKWQLKMLNVYFLIMFWSIGLLSIADIFYYKFNIRRINLEALQLLKDSWMPVVRFMGHHPEVWLILISVALANYLIFRKSDRHKFTAMRIEKKGVVLVFCSVFLLIFSISLTRYAKYFSPLSASLFVAPGYTGLYTNSPQSFMYSFHSGWTYVEPLHVYSDEQADKIVPVFYRSQNNKGEERNVVLFILESFSFSYLDQANPEKPTTPFFDSLMQHSTVFLRAYANNTTSANGLCSILSGLPSLTNQPFFSSPYAAHPIDAIAIAMREHGYTNSFFLGANDDHFGFKKGTRLLGIDHYHNGESFPKADQDGTWGVYDGPFLQYFAEQSNHKKQPFFSVFFTISTHYPFKIPDSLELKFTNKKGYANERALAYVDDAFRQFFAVVRNTAWFENTIFIFCGDHVSKENKRERQNFNFNSYFHIPMFIFDPRNPTFQQIRDVVQHTDLPATIADLTGIQDSVLCFGHSFFDTSGYRYTVNRYAENIVQMIDSTYLVQYDIINARLLDVYRIMPGDALQIDNSATTLNLVNQKHLPILKAYMQQYFNRLYYNKLHHKRV